MSQNNKSQRDQDSNQQGPPDHDDLSSESSSDDDSLVLEGILVRNPDVSSSSSSSGSEDDDDEDDKSDNNHKDADDDEKKETSKNPTAAQTCKVFNDKTSLTAAKRPAETVAKANRKKKSKQKNNKQQPEIDMVHVDFIFVDMNPKYWAGLQGLLSNAGSALYQAHASALADAVIEYDMVGTCLGQPNDAEYIVYGFASLLHWAHFPVAAQSAFSAACTAKTQDPPKDTTARTRLTKALQACQEEKSPSVAFLLSGRMMNLPVEIVLALHEQLYKDILWAQGETTKLSYKNIQTVVRLAPCTRDNNNNGSSTDNPPYAYRYFDDEFLAAEAKVSYVVEGPKSFSREDVLYLHVLELDLPGYHRAIKALERMVKG